MLRDVQSLSEPTATTSPKRPGIATEQFLATGPKKGVAQGCEFHVHGAVARATFDIFLPPFVIPVASCQRHGIGGDVFPKFQERLAVLRLHRQGAPLPLLFVPVGIAVLFIATNHLAGGDDGWFRNIRRLAFDPSLAQLLAGELQVFGAQ